ncbi:protein FAR1-RELATED SEQUENCE [Trifolium repens]|nr:protein FAR1-RELATED SEQUENCE [Trifolium repens]
MEEDWKPKLEMMFDSIEDAWKFWDDYGGKVGFSVRKQYSNKNKHDIITSYRFVCSKEGLRKPDKRDYKTINPRLETRTNCQARLGIKNMGGKFMVVDFVEEHNHDLQLPETTHMLPSQRKISQIQCQQIDLADDAGLQQRKSFDLMSKEVGGRTNLGFIRLDQKNYLRKKRARSMEHGDVGYLLQYFQKKLVENPTFYHAYQMDAEDQITNVFWADADEVMPGAYHGLCMWHLMQNAIKRCGNLMKGGNCFLSDLNKCMYGYENEEQFEEGWSTFLVKYDAKESDWLQRLYTLKEKWASCYMNKVFTLGMRSTQLSESVNADIKSFMNVKLDIIKFFKRFEDVVEEKRQNELKCEYEARQKIPRLKNSYSSILQQVSKVYTPAIFDKFQHEYELFEACFVKSINMQSLLVDCVIAMESDLEEWRVSFDLDKNSISCSCHKFESFGILCCHCLRLFIHMNVKLVPEQYILKRWTKLARGQTLSNVGVSNVVEDVDLSPTQHYNIICPRLIRIATEACRSPETFTLLCKVANELNRHMFEFQNNPTSICEVNEFIAKVKEIGSSNVGSSKATGFKKREGKGGTKRLKAWPERELSKSKKKGGPKASKVQNNRKQTQDQLIKKDKNYDECDSQSQVQYEVPNTIAPICLNQFGVTSFTSLLMGSNHRRSIAVGILNSYNFVVVPSLFNHHYSSFSSSTLSVTSLDRDKAVEKWWCGGWDAGEM